jgi:hypothetical protein
MPLPAVNSLFGPLYPAGLQWYWRADFVTELSDEALARLRARRDDLLDPVPRLEFQILNEAEEQRIGHRHRQEVFLQADREARALERQFPRDEHHRRRIGRVVGNLT